MSYFKPYFWLPIVTAFLALAVYFIFNSGPAATCVWGFAMAATLFWMREKHTIFYGVTEVVAGLFILGQNYASGRGGFSGTFNEAFQTFQWNIVLVSTLGAVYILVRGFDNIKRGWVGTRQSKLL